LPVIDGRITADNLAGSDIAGDSGLGGGDCAISYRAVTGDPNLAGENYAFANDSRSGEADLRAQQGIAAHRGAMAYLDEIIDLGAGMDAGFADAGAVDAGIRLDFDVVFENGRAGLNDFVPGFAGWHPGLFGEAEAVRSDDGSVLEDDIVAKLTMLADDGVGMGEEMIANADMWIEDHVGQESGMVADHNMIFDDDIGSDVRAGPYFCCGGDDGCGVNAGSVDRRLVEELDGACEGEIRIGDAEGRGCDFGERWLNEHGGSPGGAGERGVFGIGDEGKVAGRCGIDSGNPGDLRSSITVENGSKVLG